MPAEEEGREKTCATLLAKTSAGAFVEASIATYFQYLIGSMSFFTVVLKILS